MCGESYTGIAAKGRYGDTELAHVNTQEKQMLERAGGAGTINPDTGLKEYHWYHNHNPPVIKITPPTLPPPPTIPPPVITPPDLAPETVLTGLEKLNENTNIVLEGVSEVAHVVGTETTGGLQRIKDGERVIDWDQVLGTDDDAVSEFLVGNVYKPIADNVTEPMFDAMGNIIDNSMDLTTGIATNVADQVNSILGVTPRGTDPIDGEGVEAEEGEELTKGLRISRRAKRKGSSGKERRGGGIQLKGQGSGLNIN